MIRSISLSSFPSEKRLIFIGDVHGCSGVLHKLLSTVRFNRGRDLVIFVGDLINKGPDSKAVVALAMEIGAFSVLGNHEVAIFNALATNDANGNATGVLNQIEKRELKVAQSLSALQLEWLRRLPHIIRIPQYNIVVVHAGINANRSLDEQTVWELLHLRTIDKNGISLSSLQGTLWAELWKGPETVIFGHDAQTGLQKRPTSIGLDSACLYGGELTAYILPNKEFVSVKSHFSLLKRITPCPSPPSSKAVSKSAALKTQEKTPWQPNRTKSEGLSKSNSLAQLYQSPRVQSPMCSSLNSTSSQYSPAMKNEGIEEDLIENLLNASSTKSTESGRSDGSKMGDLILKQVLSVTDTTKLDTISMNACTTLDHSLSYVTHSELSRDERVFRNRIVEAATSLSTFFVFNKASPTIGLSNTVSSQSIALIIPSTREHCHLASDSLNMLRVGRYASSQKRRELFTKWTQDSVHLGAELAELVSHFATCALFSDSSELLLQMANETLETAWDLLKPFLNLKLLNRTIRHIILHYRDVPGNQQLREILMMLHCFSSFSRREREKEKKRKS